MPAITEANINPNLQSLVVPIDSLTPDPNNARSHGERNIRSIMDSLMRYGQQKPVVKNSSGVVVAGNGTLEAAKRLGWDKLAAVEFHLERRHAGGYALADNRTAELAEWNFPVLSSQLDLFEKDGQLELGVLWTKEEAGNLRSADFSPAPEPTGNGETPHEIMTERIEMTKEQFDIVTKAINKVRALGGHPEWSDGVCLAIIAERSM